MAFDEAPQLYDEDYINNLSSLSSSPPVAVGYRQSIGIGTAVESEMSIEIVTGIEYVVTEITIETEMN